MQLESPRGNHAFVVTKVVGGRYREDFVGVEPKSAGGDGIEHVLPATYVFSTKSWRYKGYSVMVTERPWMSWQGVWSQECIGCHNTLPLATLLYDDLFGPKLPPYQGKMQDRVLPRSRTWPAKALDERGLEGVLADEIRFLGGTVPVGSLDNLLPAAATTMEQKLDGKHLVELGIGCEACHNGAAAHAAEPKIVPSFAARQRRARGRSAARRGRHEGAMDRPHVREVPHPSCSRTIRSTWEDGLRRKNPGGSSISSGEGRDFQLGGCSTQMTCSTCHDPHTEDPKAKLAAARHARPAITCAPRATRSTRPTTRSRSTAITRLAAPAPRASRATWRRRTWGSTTC